MEASTEQKKILHDQFYEITRRIPKHEMEQISKVLSTLPDKDNCICELKNSIDAINWKTAIFNNPLYPYYALAGLRDGKLSLAEFSTILFYHAQTSDPTKPAYMPLKAVPLYLANNQANPKAKLLIETSFNTLVEAKLLKEEDKEDLFNALIEKMRSAPRSECILFTNENEENWVKVKKEINEIATRVHWGILRREPSKDNGFWIMPSLTLMQAFQHTFFGPEAVTINPVLGLSSAEDILTGSKQNKRDLAIHFPGITLPEEADDKKNIFRNDFTKHDEYHCSRSSILGNKCRAVFSRLADVVKGTNQRAYEHFLDLDFDGYERVWKQPAIDEKQLLINFWKIVMGELMMYPGDPAPMSKAGAKRTREERAKPLIDDMINYANLYEKTLGIPLNSLSYAIENYTKSIRQIEGDLTIKGEERTPNFVKSTSGGYYLNEIGRLTEDLDFLKYMQRMLDKKGQFLVNSHI